MSLFFHWISAVFSIYCYHGLSSGVQSISSVSASTFISFYFLVYWNKQIQGSSLLNNALSGAGSDQLPSWDDFVRAIFCNFMQFYFFYNSLFPGNCRPGWTIYTEKCPYLFRIDSIDFIILALVPPNCPTYFSLLPLVPINVWPISWFCHWISAVVQSIESSATFYPGCHRLLNLFLVFSSGFL